MKLEENARNDQEQDLQIHGDMILPILCGITEMPDSICQSGSNRQGARNRYTRRQSGHHHPGGRRGSKRMGAKTKFYKEGTWGNPKKEEKRQGYQEQK